MASVLGNDARKLASELIAGYESRQPFDARDLIDEHPELKDDRSAVITLAYEEYCRRQEMGERLQPSEFAARYSCVSRSLFRLIELDDFLQGHSEITTEMQAGIWPDANREFEGFKLVEELGRGALSRVFIAIETSMGNRTVVAKVCWRGAKEASVLGKLEHPGVVPVYSIQEVESSQLSVICMPLLSRCTLFDMIEKLFVEDRKPRHGSELTKAAREANPEQETPGRSTLSSMTYIDAVANIGRQLASALTYTHQRGVYHCDIKPTNVLLTPKGRALLLDFNLSVDTKGEDSLPGGTLPYMAPEHLRSLIDPEQKKLGRDACPISPRLDLYSLGATLYEMLTGRLPYGVVPTNLGRDELAEHLLRCHEQNQLRPLREVAPGVPRQLAAIIEKCLSSNPDDRPETAADLERLLKRYLNRVNRFCRWSVRRRYHIAAAVAATALCFAGFLAHPDGRWLAMKYGIIQKSPDYIFNTRLNAARTAMHAGEFAVALDELRWARNAAEQTQLSSTKQNRLFTADVLRGACQLEVGDFAGCIESLNPTQQYDRSGVVNEMLGYSHAMNKSWDAALREFEFTNLKDRQNRRITLNEAYCVATSLNSTDFVDSLTQIKRRPDWYKDPPMIYVAGMMHRRRALRAFNRKNSIRICLTRKLKIPSDEAAQHPLYLQISRELEVERELASECLRRAVKLYPTDTVCRFILITHLRFCYDLQDEDLLQECRHLFVEAAQLGGNPTDLAGILDTTPTLAAFDDVKSAYAAARVTEARSTKTRILLAPQIADELGY